MSSMIFNKKNIKTFKNIKTLSPTSRIKYATLVLWYHTECILPVALIRMAHCSQLVSPWIYNHNSEAISAFHTFYTEQLDSMHIWCNSPWLGLMLFIADDAIDEHRFPGVQLRNLLNLASHLFNNARICTSKPYVASPWQNALYIMKAFNSYSLSHWLGLFMLFPTEDTIEEHRFHV